MGLAEGYDRKVPGELEGYSCGKRSLFPPPHYVSSCGLYGLFVDGFVGRWAFGSFGP